MEQDTNKILRLERNVLGRDFIVGDIHGHFGLLESLLDQICFDKENDRLITVGDFIDRGPETLRALDFLGQPWFFSVRGNHEELLLNCYQNPYSSLYGLWMDIGGEWAEDVQPSVLEEMNEGLSKLPYAISIETVHGEVGVLHADIPSRMSWPKLLDKLSKDKLKQKDLELLLWSRLRFQGYRANPNQSVKPIKGVHKVYFGHNVVDEPTLYGNMMFLETGAYCKGRLSAIELATEEVVVVEQGDVSRTDASPNQLLVNTSSDVDQNLIEQGSILLDVGGMLLSDENDNNNLIYYKTFRQCFSDYKETPNSCTEENFQVAARTFFEQQALDGQWDNQDLAECTSDSLNKPGILRRLTLEHLQKLCDVAANQKLRCIKLGVLGYGDVIESLFDEISGGSIAIDRTNGEDSVLLWRVNVNTDVILYLIGLPIDKAGKGKYHSLLPQLAAVKLSSSSNVLTLEEKTALLSSQMLCGMDRVQVIGPYAKNESVDPIFFFQSNVSKSRDFHQVQVLTDRLIPSSLAQ